MRGSVRKHANHCLKLHLTHLYSFREHGARSLSKECTRVINVPEYFQTPGGNPTAPSGLTWVGAARNIQMMGCLHWQHCNMPNRLGRTGQWSTASMFPVKHSCALLQNFYTLTSRWLPITSKSSSNISIHLNQAFTLRGLVRRIPGKVQRPLALRFYDAGLTRVPTAIGV